MLFLQACDYKEATVWLDNCADQNKYWCLLFYLVYIIISEEICAKTITLQYFELGYTFMSADSFHNLIENGLRKQTNVYGFKNFVDVVKSYSSKMFE